MKDELILPEATVRGEAWYQEALRRPNTVILGGYDSSRVRLTYTTQKKGQFVVVTAMATDMLTDKSGEVEVVAFCTLSQVGDILSAQRRDSEQEFSVILDEPFRYIVQGDSFMGVTTHSKNPELAKAFVEWFYSEAWYPGYLSYISSASSISAAPCRSSIFPSS